VSVDGHGDSDVAVPDDFADDVRRHAEVEQETHVGVSEVVELHVPEAGDLADRSPATPKVYDSMAVP
jgi:hypothetical protein